MVTLLVDLWESSIPAFLCAVAACVYLLWLSVILSAIDIHTHTLPNRYVLPAYPIAGALLVAAALTSGSPASLARAVGGAALMVVLYWILWALHPSGLGFGDVKLAGVLGLYLGFLSWQHVALGAAAGFVLGGLWALAHVASGRGTIKSPIPFGPSMLAGTLAVLLLVPA
ncbi:leader peptidase (prepilin peptidase) / N-methyltransferase [Arthrobacter alpinus]|uniref:Leader peptidase (Prepilin peptidase) / N-methyltransferase n=1 Tax=Arthrobacter alpinus TaxID=656366 RepID=A0A0U3P5M1_9MICC|nr:A24 family peptidase [Arthrobacter alpinus]ALV44495.1 hypothetical protein MB46_02145 [Arthrobacter alpinus]SEE66668.1 leader peptidase (prepilin peptidase) / N-methyltransferase [Arthrobacter alpinus]